MSSIVLPITQAPEAKKTAAPPVAITPPDYHFGCGDDDDAFADLAEIPDMELAMAQQRAQQRADAPAKRRTTITDVAFSAVVGTGCALTSVGKSGVSAVQIVGKTGVNAVQSAGKTGVISAVQSAVVGTGAVALNVGKTGVNVVQSAGKTSVSAVQSAVVGTGLNVPLNMAGKTARMLGSVVPMSRLSSAADSGHAPLKKLNEEGGEETEEPISGDVCENSSEKSADVIGEPTEEGKCDDTSQKCDDSSGDGKAQGSGETLKPPRREEMTFAEGTSGQVEHSNDQTETLTPDAKLTELLGYNTYEDQTVTLEEYSSSQEETKARARKSSSSKNRRRDHRGSKTKIEDGTEQKEKISSSRSSSTRKTKLSRSSETGTRSKRESGKGKTKSHSPRRSTDDKKTLQNSVEEALKEVPKEEEQDCEGMPAQRKSDTYLGGILNVHGDSEPEISMTKSPARASSDTSLGSSRHKKESCRKSRNCNKNSTAARRSISPIPNTSKTREGFLTRANSCRAMSIEQRRTQSLRQSCVNGSTAGAMRQLSSDAAEGNSNQHRLQRTASFRIQTLKENSQGNKMPHLRRSRSVCSAQPASSKIGRPAKKNLLEETDGLESGKSWHGDKPAPATAKLNTPDSTGQNMGLSDVAASIAVLMGMMQGMQAEIVALRKEVKDLKAERDLSSTSNHNCRVCKAEKYSSALAEIKPTSGHRLPSLYCASNNDDSSESEVDDDEDDDINSIS